MVEANADAEVVTARILRETREAREETALERAEKAAEVSAPAPAVASVAGVPAPAPRPQDSAGYARAAKLSVMTALALVLVLLWIRLDRRA